MPTNRQAISIRLHPETIKDLERCTAKLRTNKTAVIERALLAFVQKECAEGQRQQQATE